MSQLVRGARKLAKASKLERRAVIIALLMSPRIGRSLRKRGYAATRQWLEDVGSPSMGSPTSTHALMMADQAIRHFPFDVKCLQRSLTIWWLAGDDAVIRLGVAPGIGGADHRFHAWVERDGRVLNDTPHVADEFLPLAGHAIESTDPRLFGWAIPTLRRPHRSRA